MAKKDPLGSTRTHTQEMDCIATPTRQPRNPFSKAWIALRLRVLHAHGTLLNHAR